MILFLLTEAVDLGCKLFIKVCLYIIVIAFSHNSRAARALWRVV